MWHLIYVSKVWLANVENKLDNPTPGHISGQNITQKDTCTPMPTVALYAIARAWQKPKCPLTDEWIKKMWYIETMEYYSAIKMNEIMPLAAMQMD